MKFKKYINEAIRLKKVVAGQYEAKIGDIQIDVYKAESGDYWSSTIVVGKYGDDNWQEQSIQGQNKRELMRDIENFVRKVK